MSDIYMKVKHSDYIALKNDCDALKKENATLKKQLEKVVEKNAETTKTETKKGGNK